MKSQGIEENSEQFKTPAADTTAERPDSAESQEPEEQPETPAEDKSDTGTPSKAKHFLKEAFQILFTLVVVVALCHFFWMGVKKVYNRYHVESREHLTEKIDLVQYGNDDYQLRRADKHGKFSERFDDYPDLWDNGQVVHYYLREGGERTVSLKTLVTVECDRICPPDYRGVAACIDNHMELSFWNLHKGTPAFDARFTLEKDFYDGDDPVRFEEMYCVFPTPDGACLIDTNGNVLLHDLGWIELVNDRYITTRADWRNDWKESLYDARDMRCLLTDKNDIRITPVGIFYTEGDQRYLMDTSFTQVITNLVVDDYSDEYYEEYNSIERVYEPKETLKDSGYKLFCVNLSYGVFDRDYHVVIKPEWESIKYLGDGYFECTVDDLAVIVDRKGNVLPYRE